MVNVKTALVAGGTGGIGEGIVQVLLEGGWTVYVPVRGADRGDRLRSHTVPAALDRLHLFPVDLAASDEVARFKTQIAETAGRLDLVVVSVGSTYYGHSLHQIPRADWDRLLAENLATHFNLQHEFLGWLHLQNHGTYVTLTGPEADFAHPETGLMSVFAAAQKMMARVGALEASGSKVRVHSVTSKTPVATQARGDQVEASWLTPVDLGLYVAALAAATVPGSSEALHVLESRDQVRKLVKHPAS